MKDNNTTNVELENGNPGFYRCGYCGQPTDKDGEPLDLEACKTWQEDKAELLHGNCCVYKH